jgi:hypothetical protein
MFIRLLPNVKKCHTDNLNCNPMPSMVEWSFIYGDCLLFIVWVLYCATSGKAGAYTTERSKVSGNCCDCSWRNGSSHRGSRRGSLLAVMPRLRVGEGETNKQRSKVKSYLAIEQNEFVRHIANLRQKPCEGAENGFPGKVG